MSDKAFAIAMANTIPKGPKGDKGDPGGVTSVNGKTGEAVLDSGDLGYDASETYTSGTVGAEVSQLKSDISNLSLVYDVDFDSSNFGGGTGGWYISSAGKLTASGSWKTVYFAIPPYLKKIEGAFGSATSSYHGIAFYSSNTHNADTFISGAVIGTNGSVHTVTVPANAVDVIITTRPGSYAKYYAKLYFDYNSDLVNGSEQLKYIANESGYSNYQMLMGYYNSAGIGVVASAAHISTTKIPTYGAKNIWASCPGYLISVYKYTAWNTASGATLTNVNGNWPRVVDTSAANWFAVCVKKTDSSALTDDDIADIKSKLSIVRTIKPYLDQKAAYESTIVGANEDREQLFSNFVWPINPDGGDAIDNAGKMLNLLHFSDIHSDGTNLQRVMDYYNAKKDMLADVLFTGDYVNEHYGNSFTFWTNVAGTDKILGVIGNHDATSTDSDHYATDVSQADLFSTFFYGIAGWGVTYTADTTWWYKDYATQGIRLIGLNSSLSSENAATQLAWLADVLADAKTNSLAVAIAIHFPVAGDKVESLFSSIDYTGAAVASHRVSTDIIGAVDDFIDAEGHFICYITGHTHSDFIFSATAVNTQMCIAVTTAKNENGGFYGDQARKAGTRSNDAFNLISIDKIGHTVKLIRIGANVDHYIRPRNTLAFNYLTGEIISET